MSYLCTGLDGTQMAWCSTGEHFAPVGDFGEDASTSDGLAKECRVCGRDRRRERSEDPGVRAREKERAKDRRKVSPAERRRRREQRMAYTILRATERTAKPELTLDEAQRRVEAKATRPPRPKSIDPRDVLPRRARYGNPGSWDVAPVSEWRVWAFLRLEKVGYRNPALKTLCDLSLDTIAAIRRHEVHPEVCARFESAWKEGQSRGVHRNPYPRDDDPPPPGTPRPLPSPAVVPPSGGRPETAVSTPAVARDPFGSARTQSVEVVPTVPETAAAKATETATPCTDAARRDSSRMTDPLDECLERFPPSEPEPVDEEPPLPAVTPARLLALRVLTAWSRNQPPSALASTWSRGFTPSEVKRCGPAAHRQGRSDPSADLDLLARLNLVRKVGDRYVPVREVDPSVLGTLPTSD